ncbi:MAG TPA: hypothetical protein VMX17_11955 [Candidatus Glassbacteria bacterium]|nr:hypothetical protein [Candidatus Glassbacteria bacterium]
MPTESKLYLILGCWGRVDGDFTTCNSVANPILKIDETLEGYVELTKYFQGLGLFEQKITNYNAVRNILFGLKNRFPQGYYNLWKDKKFRLIENFTISHKFCGLYLDLDFVDDEFFKKYTEERFVIIEPTKK